MATLLLTAAGTAIGGPIGGALGALAGQAIDTRLLGSRGRTGARLNELAVQTSSYGTPIPHIFGTMRVAGTVIWSTELIEQATRQGGGKGRSAGTSYTYAASFAVLLSARSIRSVGRIWADGKLLRGAAGDFKTATRFRLYLGDEDQAPDPLIVSSEGIGQVPGCRGHAYAVFEELALADFGNRIPSLTFEVEADAGPMDCGAMLEQVSGGMVRGQTGLALPGYAAHGDTLRQLVDGLGVASGAWAVAAGRGLELQVGTGPSIDVEDLGAGKGARDARTMAAADVAPRAVSVQYHDPARDYQGGLQSVRRAGAGGREQRIVLPAAIEAGQAKQIAASALTRADIGRERRTVSLDWRSMGIAPGDCIGLAGTTGSWRVIETTLAGMVMTVELARITRPSVARTATSGRVTAAPDLAIGRTIVRAVELPSLDDRLLSAPRIAILADGDGAGWRGAALHLSLDGGITWSDAGLTRGRSMIGQVMVPPGGGSSTLVDRASRIEVELAHPAMTLSDADASALDRGANLAIVGDELVQFGSASRLGPTRWRLGELWRGRRGTEWACGSAREGDGFALVDAGAVTTVDLPPDAIGTTVQVMAVGIGDDDAPPVATVTVDGRSVAPPAPVHLRLVRDGSGDRLEWVRRSRLGWHWVDRMDVALGEERERYAVAVDGAAEVAVDADVLRGMSFGRASTLSLRQIGTLMPSRASAIN